MKKTRIKVWNRKPSCKHFLRPVQFFEIKVTLITISSFIINVWCIVSFVFFYNIYYSSDISLAVHHWNAWMLEATATVHSIYHVWLIGHVLIDKSWSLYLTPSFRPFLTKFSYSIVFGLITRLAAGTAIMRSSKTKTSLRKNSSGFGLLPIQTKDPFRVLTKAFDRNTKQLNKTDRDISNVNWNAVHSIEWFWIIELHS